MYVHKNKHTFVFNIFLYNNNPPKMTIPPKAARLATTPTAIPAISPILRVSD